jgi:hypothetical protein
VYCFTFDLARPYAVPLPSATIMGCPAAFGVLGRSRGLLARSARFCENFQRQRDDVVWTLASRILIEYAFSSRTTTVAASHALSLFFLRPTSPAPSASFNHAFFLFGAGKVLVSRGLLVVTQTWRHVLRSSHRSLEGPRGCTATRRFPFRRTTCGSSLERSVRGTHIPGHQCEASSASATEGF